VTDTAESDVDSAALVYTAVGMALVTIGGFADAPLQYGLLIGGVLFATVGVVAAWQAHRDEE